MPTQAESPPPHFYTAPGLWEKLKPLAREKRRTPTPAEDFLWQRLRSRKLHSAKFRRQFTIDRFIVDFVCLEHKLVIEVDGPIHAQQVAHDAIRQEVIELLGFTVMRFTNNQVFHETDDVLMRIARHLGTAPR